MYIISLGKKRSLNLGHPLFIDKHEIFQRDFYVMFISIQYYFKGILVFEQKCTSEGVPSFLRCFNYALPVQAILLYPVEPRSNCRSQESDILKIVFGHNILVNCCS